VGGGREEDSAELLQSLQARHGQTAGAALWRDLREADDPEAPVTADRPFRYNTVRPSMQFPGVALPDPGSITDRNPLTAMMGALGGIGLPFPLGASNWLAVTADR